MGIERFIPSPGGFVGHFKSRPKRNFDMMNGQNGIGAAVREPFTVFQSRFRACFKAT
jgi:hypothetical protein